MTAVAILERDNIIEQIAAGHRVRSIAQKLGISHAAISKQLANDPEYQAAISTGHADRLDRAEEEIEVACDQVTTARARALWSAVAWRAERECPARWGQRTQVSLDVTLELGPALRGALDRAGRADAIRTVSLSPVQHAISGPKDGST